MEPISVPKLEPKSGSTVNNRSSAVPVLGYPGVPHLGTSGLLRRQASGRFRVQFFMQKKTPPRLNAERLHGDLVASGADSSLQKPPWRSR
jgi:hypothetical protein